MFPITSFEKGFLICLLCWIVGTVVALDYPMLLKSSALPNYHFIYSKSLYINFSASWMVLLNNLFTGFILCILGYLSFGFLAIMVSLYNGYIFGLVVNTFVSKYTFASMYLVFLHAPMEVYALCYLGAIGLMGFSNLRKILAHEPIVYFEQFPRLPFFFLPILFLAIAACIESDLLFNIIL